MEIESLFTTSILRCLFLFLRTSVFQKNQFFWKTSFSKSLLTLIAFWNYARAYLAEGFLYTFCSYFAFSNSDKKRKISLLKQLLLAGRYLIIIYLLQNKECDFSIVKEQLIAARRNQSFQLQYLFCCKRAAIKTQSVFQATKRPESKRPGAKSRSIQSPSVRSPSVKLSRVQGSRMQVFRRPESKLPECKHPSLQIPSVQESRVQASGPCVQSPAFPVCYLLYLSALSKQLQQFCIKQWSAAFVFPEAATGGAL